VSLKNRLLRLVIVLSIVAITVLLALNHGTLSKLWHSPDVPAEVVAEAKRHVTAPKLPPAPTGTEEVTYEDKYGDVQTPVLTFTNILPQVTTQIKRVVIDRVQHSVTRPPANEAVASWRAETDRLNAEYQGELQDKIDEIQTRKKKELRDALQAWVGIVGGIVACMVSSTTLFFAMRKARRKPSSETQSGRIIIT
jgi:hypothetical protein